MAIQTTVAMNGAQVDAQIFDFSPGTYGQFDDVYPKVKAIILSQSAAAAVRVYFAPGAGAGEEDRYDVINETDPITNAIRGCYPVWLQAGPIPWTLRMERAAAVDSFVRIEWEPT